MIILIHKEYSIKYNMSQFLKNFEEIGNTRNFFNLVRGYLLKTLQQMLHFIVKH